MALAHQGSGGQRFRSFTTTTSVVPSLPPYKRSTVFLTAASGPSSDDDDGGDESDSGPKSRVRSSKFVKTRLIPSSKEFLFNPLFTLPNALLRTSSFRPKSISSLLLVDMQEQSPPPYSPLEFDLNVDDSSSHSLSQLQQTASSTTIIPLNPPSLSHSYSSCSANCSHSQCRIRKRDRTSSGSFPPSLFPSPTISDSEAEDGTIYTSQGVRQRIVKESRGQDSGTSNGTSRRPANIKSKRSWRHWLFALAAGVVGLGDGRDDEREEKMICTTPGGICAGETETETDEPSRHLPTARIIPPSESSHLLGTTLQQLQHKLIPLLFEFSRLLSVVPAFFGTIWNLYWLIWPPSRIDTVTDYGGWDGRKTPPERADFFVAALWSILTGYQCLALTTGLLTRWQTYYPALSSLIRLLALQGICWPATQLTLTVLDPAKRPVVCWCVVGTTTCFSRSVQIWVTSNISAEEPAEVKNGTNPTSGSLNGHPPNVRPGPDTFSILNSGFPHRMHHSLAQCKPRFRWTNTERRWDWKEVSLKCILPAGILYFVTAWVGEFRREWAGC